MTDPKILYQNAIKSGELLADPEQAKLINALQKKHALFTEKMNAQSHWWLRLSKKARQTIPGLYIWGEVGLGKTHLLNFLYQSLPIKKKKIHFHAFMNDVHQALFRLQGKKNPIKQLSEAIAREAQLLFLDEFVINDIADAMVLAGLLENLMASGVCIITSSNTAPSNLYKDGFQRKKFLPSIELIEKNMDVIEVTIDRDYRRLKKDSLIRYLTPIHNQTAQELSHCYNTISEGHTYHDPLSIVGREVPNIRYSKSTLWASCEQLCSPPRCSRDYLSIAERFKHVIISGVPVFQTNDTNMVARFIKLIDVLYDQDVELFISAEKDVDDLYPKGKLKENFKRTQSRIIEMTAKGGVTPL